MNEPANEASNIGPLSEEDICGMQILNFCFMAGMVGFLGVIVFLFINSTRNLLNLLSLIASVTYMAIAFPAQTKLTRLFSLEKQALYR